MGLPNLYVYHPPQQHDPLVIEWLADVKAKLDADAHWDHWNRLRIPYDLQAGFNFGTEVDRVRKAPGPAIFIQKVRVQLLTRFRATLGKLISIYPIAAGSAEDIYKVCEQARLAYEVGEPLVPLREILGYLIIVKLAKRGAWGGTALYKKNS
jgi:hypothetical protein